MLSFKKKSEKYRADYHPLPQPHSPHHLIRTKVTESY